MKREIKFRGKRIDNGEWIYGDVIRICGLTFIFPYPAPDGFYRYEVDPETVGQYTGLKDKNGVEIYEGEIIKFIETKDSGFNCAGGHYCDENKNTTHYAKVGFNKGAFDLYSRTSSPSILHRWMTKWKEEIKDCVLFSDHVHTDRIAGYSDTYYEGIEIIGNLTDNPEMMEGGGEHFS